MNGTERETIRRYTRRVRALSIVSHRPDQESLIDLCLPSSTSPFFSNTRELYFYVADRTLPFIHYVVSPKLRSFRAHFGVSNTLCKNLVQSLGGATCTDVKTVDITSLSTPYQGVDRTVRHWTCRREVDFSAVRLDVDSLLHLSYISGLTTLAFTPSHGLTDQRLLAIESISVLTFFPGPLPVHLFFLEVGGAL